MDEIDLYLMSTVQGTITGTHPLGEPLIQAILDYKYGRAGNEPVIEKFDSELQNLITLQETLNFNFISTGNLGVEDLIRPFTRSLNALKSYQQLGDLPINRFHYTNTFYRQPTVVDKLPKTSNIIMNDTNTITGKNAYSINSLDEKEGKLIIPGPLSFAKMVQIDEESPYLGLDELILDAAKLIASEIANLPSHIEQIQFDDPFLVWERVPRTLRPTIVDAYQIIRDNVNQELLVHTYFESADTIASFLLDLDVDGFGIDFYRTNLLSLKNLDFSGKIIQAGLVDSQNFVPNADGNLDVSDTHYLAKLGQAILELDPEKLLIGTTTGLEYVPRDIADQKLEQVSTIAQLIQEA